MLAGWSGAELRWTLRGGGGQCGDDLVGARGQPVDRGAGLLAPGFVEAARVDGVEAEFVEQGRRTRV
ncbi:hypothetical protein SSBG_01074 [Streptomyces sp. SPB074]|nr:hypothetical protein SSBG_01074 [Streptomyces sp. SPB074]